ncbi:SigE family RNA polymerase sigma factor [Nocardioides hwasunensis]|uniref:SigE family RNA polymerase sigma factor n=1 Tax=Nocardioides hwasunensis TaxID=397258 RepID=A0ABR8MNJ4_9ACTN|nr:SigE family RNA polymerase sigma factor [Nocardioides hwasunensis]MBD3916596.1 SigE family RNA polymerase sigma factor [Nocardioides hwasunensis]
MPRSTEEFEEFAVARTPQLFRAAWLMCGDTHRAEDLVQETLAKVYVRWHRRLGPPIEHPVAYAHTTLARTYLSAQRRRSTHERPTEHLLETAVSDGDAATRLALRAALDELAPMDRAVLVLRFLEDVSVADTADALGVSPGAVRNRTIRALDRLRAVLGPSLHDLLET